MTNKIALWNKQHLTYAPAVARGKTDLIISATPMPPQPKHTFTCVYCQLDHIYHYFKVIHMLWYALVFSQNSFHYGFFLCGFSRVPRSPGRHAGSGGQPARVCRAGRVAWGQKSGSFSTQIQKKTVTTPLKVECTRNKKVTLLSGEFLIGILNLECIRRGRYFAKSFRTGRSERAKQEIS